MRSGALGVAHGHFVNSHAVPFAEQNFPSLGEAELKAGAQWLSRERAHVDMASNIAFPAQLGEVAFMLWLVKTYGYWQEQKTALSYRKRTLIVPGLYP